MTRAVCPIDRGTSPHARLLGAYRVGRARAAGARDAPRARGQASELTRSEHLHVAHRRAQQLLKVGYCSIRDGRSMDGQRWCVLVQCVSSTVLSEQLVATFRRDLGREIDLLGPIWPARQNPPFLYYS